MTRTSGVYIIKNSTSGKCYIGSSADIQGRFRQHRYLLRLNKHHSLYLQSSWNKHNENVFSFEILELCDCDRVTLLKREQFYLDAHKPSYNILLTAGSRLNYKVSDATREKQKKRVVSEATREKLRQINLNMSDETKAKISAAQIGRKATDQTRARMSAAHTGKTPRDGAIELTIQKRHKKRLQRIADITTALKIRTCSRNDVRHTLRRLSDDNIRAIRSSSLFSKELANTFGVSESAINKIRRGIVYKDVS